MTAIPILGAVILVKDEVKTIENTLKSLIRSRIEVLTVLDTGSTDGTQDLIRATFPNVVLVEEAFPEPFNYADARNRARAIAAEKNPTVFDLMLSADETVSLFTIEGHRSRGEELHEFLESVRDVKEGSADAYCVMMRVENRQFPFPRILRSQGGWKYVTNAGTRHETPVGPEGQVLPLLIKNVYVVHTESDPQRKLTRLRRIDLPDMTAVVEDETKPPYERAEAIFQLAETHFILGFNEPLDDNGKRESGGRWISHIFDAMALYSRYAEIAEQEGSPAYDLYRAMYARVMYCHAAETIGLFEPKELVKRLVLIAQVAPNMPEAHWMLANNTAKVDPRKAITLAMRSAKIAQEVMDNPTHGAVDTTIGWRSLLLAADCSRVCKQPKLQASFVKQARMAGAPEDIIGALADVAPVEASS